MVDIGLLCSLDDFSEVLFGLGLHYNFFGLALCPGDKSTLLEVVNPTCLFHLLVGIESGSGDQLCHFVECQFEVHAHYEDHFAVLLVILEVLRSIIILLSLTWHFTIGLQ